MNGAGRPAGNAGDSTGERVATMNYTNHCSNESLHCWAQNRDRVINTDTPQAPAGSDWWATLEGTNTHVAAHHWSATDGATGPCVGTVGNHTVGMAVHASALVRDAGAATHSGTARPATHLLMRRARSPGRRRHGGRQRDVGRRPVASADRRGREVDGGDARDRRGRARGVCASTSAAPPSTPAPAPAPTPAATSQPTAAADRRRAHGAAGATRAAAQGVSGWRPGGRPPPSRLAQRWPRQRQGRRWARWRPVGPAAGRGFPRSGPGEPGAGLCATAARSRASAPISRQARVPTLQETNPRYRGFWTQKRGLTRPFSATRLTVALHG